MCNRYTAIAHLLLWWWSWKCTRNDLIGPLALCNTSSLVGLLSQPNCAAACISFGKNISAKSLHLTLLYPTALTSTNDHMTVLRHYVCT